MKSSNRMVVRVLKASKEYLWDGIGPCLSYTVRYICNAVYCTTTNGPVRSRAWTTAVFEIQDMITDRIDKCSTLEDWLRAQGVNNIEINSLDVQAHRLAWVDILIAEFSSK